MNDELPPAPRPMTALDAKPDRERLIHDLEVHQVELEIQNRDLRETQQRLEEATLRYSELYDFAPVGYCTLTPDGLISEINLTGAALLGMPREQLLGKSFGSVSPLRDRRVFAGHLERCNTAKRRVTSELTLLQGRQARAVHIVSEPSLDPSGRVTGYRTILIDVSEMKRLEHSSRLLSEAGNALSSSLDFMSTLNTLAWLAVPAIADLCMVDVRSDDEKEERLVVAFADPRKQEALADQMKEFRPRAGWQTAQTRVIATGEPMLLSEVSGDQYDQIAQDEHHASVLRAVGIKSLIVVPLSAHGRTFGAVTLAATESERRYLLGDFQLAQDLANRAAMALDNARLYAKAQAAIDELRATQAQLHELNQTLEQRVGERTTWLTLLHDVTYAINDSSSWDEALRRVLQRICQSERWQIGYVYLPDPEKPDMLVPAISCFGDERFRAFHVVSELQRYRMGQSLPGRVYADGTPVWLNDPQQIAEMLPIREKVANDVGLKAAAALPIRFGRDTMAVLELFSDEPHTSNELLENLMNDVGIQLGKVLERERMTAQTAELVWREQQGLLHTLHDSLGQTLTGLGMLSSGLRRQLAASNRDAAETARQVAEQARLALEEVRQLSRGLFPIEVDPDGLVPALRELASTTQTFHKIRVDVHVDATLSIHDSRVATQLYRIAQEAVTNAVKHAVARIITVDVQAESGMTTLRVTDDGIGIRERSMNDGLGLRIMRYRAASIGGTLAIEPGKGGGTVVTCMLRQTHSPTAGTS